LSNRKGIQLAETCFTNLEGLLSGKPAYCGVTAYINSVKSILRVVALERSMRVFGKQLSMYFMQCDVVFLYF